VVKAKTDFLGGSIVMSRRVCVEKEPVPKKKEKKGGRNQSWKERKSRWKKGKMKTEALIALAFNRPETGNCFAAFANGCH
jgi:hypothetical protein